MIYTVTFNPSLDYIVSVDDFKLGMTNRTYAEEIYPGGKGINVSIVLNNLGFHNTALGFVGGFTGEEIEKRIRESGCNTWFIHVHSGISRINVKLKNIEGTEINGMGPDISEEAFSKLLNKLEELNDGDVLILAGSIPTSINSQAYSIIMNRIENKNILVVVDATKDLLVNVLKHHPFLIKPNNHELGEIFGVEINTKDDVKIYGKKLQEMGARNVLVSMAGEGAVFIGEHGECYETVPPEGTLVNGVGAGDSMVAGFMAGWLESADYEHAFYKSVACGSASAFSEYLATKEQVETVYAALMKINKRGECV